MNVARVGLIVAAAVAGLVAAYALFRAIDDRTAPPIVIEDAAMEAPIVVDVRGAVARPGVYEVPAGSRVQDAVRAAGGLSPSADLATINLASRLRDGDVLVIAQANAALGTPAIVDGETGEGSETSRININTATAQELDLLPGIGEVTAQRIIDFREQHGPYRSVDDLVLVQGISARMVNDLRPLLSIGP